MKTKKVENQTINNYENQKFLNLTDLCNYLRITKRQWYSIMNRCLIPYKKPFGKLVMFEKTNVDKYLAEQEVIKKS